MKARKAIVLALCLLLSLSTAWGAKPKGKKAPAKRPARVSTQADRELKTHQGELAKLRAQIEREKREVRDKMRQEEGLTGELARLNVGVRRQRQLVAALDQTQRSLQTAIEENSRRVDSLSGAVAAQRAAVGRRARDMYRKGRPRSAELLFRAAERGLSPAEIRMWQRVLDGDRRLIESLRGSLAELDDEAALLKSRRAENERLRAERRVEYAQLQSRQADREKRLAQVRDDRSRRQQLIDEHEASQKALLAVIAKLEAARKKAEEAARRSGKAVKARTAMTRGKSATPSFKRCWPVVGEVAAPYGLVKHAGLGTVTRNLGMEIASREGARVRSVAKGSVAYVGPIQGQGLSLILTHGAEGYYSVYAHLSGVKVRDGQGVEACQEIASIAEVGSPYGTTLFFQLKQGMESIDPMDWLHDARRMPG